MLRKISFARPILWLVSLVAVTSASAQISVPAAVVDPSGKSVHGLQKSDFEVQCPKSASFDSVEEVPPLNFSNFADPVPVFILFDAISIHQPAQGEVSRWLLSYLRKAADEHLAVTLLANTAKGIVVVHDMSTDSRVFAAAMDHVSPKAGQPPANPTSSGPADDFTKAVNEEVSQLQELTKPVPPVEANAYVALMSQQLESLRIVGKMLQRSRKRKPLVWISGSFPIHVENGDLAISYGYLTSGGSMEYNGKGSEKVGVLNSAYQAAIDSLNDARISVYPLPAIRNPTFFEHPEPMKANNEGAMAAARQKSNGSEYTSPAGLPGLANRTGGSLLHAGNATDFASAMADLRGHFDSYYLLTFTIQPARKRIWIDSSIKVSKPGTKIAAANGFFSSHE